MAISVCSQLNLTGIKLNECIFDVAVTNDTSLTEQEAFKIGNIHLKGVTDLTLVEIFILFVRMSNSMFWQRSLC